MSATCCAWCRDGQKRIEGVRGCLCPCHAGYRRPSWKARAERLRIRVLNGGAKMLRSLAVAGWRATR
jgi:hypothetical protein